MVERLYSSLSVFVPKGTRDKIQVYSAATEQKLLLFLKLKMRHEMIPSFLLSTSEHGTDPKGGMIPQGFGSSQCWAAPHRRVEDTQIRQKSKGCFFFCCRP